jgi:hypothetical protein
MANTNSEPTKLNLSPLGNLSPSASTDDSDFIKNLVSDGELPEHEMMESAPELNKSLMEEVAPPRSMFLLMLKVLFTLMFIGGVGAVGFFTVQLTDYAQVINQQFSIPNLASDLATKNTDIITNQANINEYRYLQAKAYLDKFSYDSDNYLKNYEILNSSTSSATEKATAKQAMADIRTLLKASLSAAKEMLVAPLEATLADDGVKVDDTAIIVSPKQKFIDKTMANLQTKAQEFAANTDPAAILDYKNYTYAASLVTNDALRQLIAGVDFEKLSDAELYAFIKQANLLAVNDFSMIQKIKENRIEWSAIIHEIDLRTMIADQNYTKDNYEQYGGIRYTSYSFDTESRQISVVGETKKTDTTTFTSISNLIDALNNSKLFENAEMRSFSKSGKPEEGYISSLRIAFHLIDPNAKAEVPAEEVAPDEAVDEIGME